jgi:hypothetical protein
LYVWTTKSPPTWKLDSNDSLSLSRKMSGIIRTSMASRKPWDVIRKSPCRVLVGGYWYRIIAFFRHNLGIHDYWPFSTSHYATCDGVWDYKLMDYYRIVSQLACMLDLNTLHDLSRTCRQFRANLFQYRTMLKTLTLCCENESPDPTGTLVEEGQGLTAAQLYSQPKRSGRFTSGKIGPCARDMVGECRKCSKIVCRVR